MLVAEAIFLAFWAGAYLFKKFITIVDESTENATNQANSKSKNEYLANELFKLKNFISSHFKDTCGLCHKPLEPDQMVMMLS